MTKQRFIRLATLLAVLAVTLGLGLAPVRQASAAECCEDCEAWENYCISAPTESPCYGDSICCFNEIWPCYRHCIYCG